MHKCINVECIKYFLKTQQNGNRRKLYLIKAIYEKPSANIIFNGE